MIEQSVFTCEPQHETRVDVSKKAAGRERWRQEVQGTAAADGEEKEEERKERKERNGKKGTETTGRNHFVIQLKLFDSQTQGMATTKVVKWGLEGGRKAEGKAGRNEALGKATQRKGNQEGVGGWEVK